MHSGAFYRSRLLLLRRFFGFWPASLAVCNTMILPFFTFIDRPSTRVQGPVKKNKKKLTLGSESKVSFESYYSIGSESIL
jgi:hypothetical protein